MIKSQSLLKRILSNFKEQIVEIRSNELNPHLEISLVNGHFVLNSKNANYSYGGLHRAFQGVFNKIKFPDNEQLNVLVLGYGAGSVAHILLNEKKINCRITGVEIDKDVIRLGEKYFPVNSDSHVRIVNSDAIEFIDSNSEKFDIIVVDVYIDMEVPAKFEEESFIRSLHGHMTPDSIIIFNKMIYIEHIYSNALSLKVIFTEVFGNAEIIQVREEKNNYMIVSRLNS